MILMTVTLVLVGGLAWLTRHPDADIVRRAESWPFVGSLASGFRQSYRVSPPLDIADSEAPNDGHTEIVESVIPPMGRGYVWVVPGTIMRHQPDETSPKILQFDAIANVTWLEKKRDWYRVWRRNQEGWVYLEGYDDEEPPYGSEPEPPRPLPSQEPEKEDLRVARGYLGAPERLLAVGPYQLYTDSRDDGLLAHLDRLASRLEDGYVKRLGRNPVDASPKEIVVLYQDEKSYRQLQNRSARLVGLIAGGHTRSGLAVLYVGPRSQWEVGSTLIHELVHTLNRRALGPALPSWLDEGLADDLALAAVAETGDIHLGSLGGERLRVEGEITMRGGVASLWGLRDAAREGRLPHVRELLLLDWEKFVRADRARSHYAAAAFWVRFLLDGDDGRLAEPFRLYLHDVSQGEPATPEALRRRLDLPWSVLDARYQLWIDFQRPVTHLTEPP